MYTAYLLLAASFSLALAGENRILNGSPASIAEFPHQVELQYSMSGHHCGGSIISSEWVVTAAHCLSAQTVNEKGLLTVRSGTATRQTGGSVHMIVEAVKHRLFSMYTMNGDIALIKVSPPFAFGGTRAAIPLYESYESIPAGSQATVTGWGLTQMKTLPYQLQKMTVPMVDRQQCARSYIRQNLVIGEGHICAGDFHTGTRDSCSGDSGGPLVVNGKLAGVVSFGIECGKPQYPGVYTNIAHYREWIRRVSGV